MFLLINCSEEFLFLRSQRQQADRRSDPYDSVPAFSQNPSQSNVSEISIQIPVDQCDEMYDQTEV